MIVIALGANLPSKVGTPVETLTAAVKQIGDWPQTSLLKQSAWYRTKPVGPVEQSDYVNGIIAIDTSQSPVDLLRELLHLERSFGRERLERWGPRTLDLDIIDYKGWVAEITQNGLRLTLPHPRLSERSFVLIPLKEIAPDWVHPLDRLSIDELLAKRPEEEKSGISPVPTAKS